ncbi:D-alanyl-D-alanine carboxypeptidase [Saccharothrix coeruleofusca]|uniref:serine hydrolase domain-containing protein n=1 Tax=Saccharothrix coeruleofusca TaxID=33919 RepID=UPI001AE4DF6D|nr:serine hydrolase domain-containing protein [Saccharothrix coeruleofusca]MBP2336059.1 D-alanyl-D-alanine carboxypeptidase [Saccharothrix coeruleofusca]
MTRRSPARLIALACALAACLTTPAVATAAPDDHTATQALLDRYRSQAGPGAALHAGDRAGTWTLSSGTAVVNRSRPITSDDHFRIGSQTKTFTAAVVLQLVDEGAVELDAPISRYLPGVVTGNYDGDAITVRQLLQHTSGLVRDVRDAAAGSDGTYALAELVRSAMDERAQFPPGTAQGYSNVGYLVLGMLVERITGEPVGTAITERVITPLGLDETSFPAPGVRALDTPYLPGYVGGRLGPLFFWVEATTAIELSFWSSAGAMASTPEDLAAFYRALLDGRVVSAAALAEMRRTFQPADVYGLALTRVSLSCGGSAWGHNGILPTGHNSTTLVTDDGRFASVVTNTNIINATPSAVDVLDSALCEGQS